MFCGIQFKFSNESIYCYIVYMSLWGTGRWILSSVDIGMWNGMSIPLGALILLNQILIFIRLIFVFFFFIFGSRTGQILEHLMECTEKKMSNSNPNPNGDSFCVAHSQNFHTSFQNRMFRWNIIIIIIPILKMQWIVLASLNWWSKQNEWILANVTQFWREQYKLEISINLSSKQRQIIRIMDKYGF